MTRETDVRRLFVLHCGYEIIPRSISLRGADPRFLHAVPITCYLLDTAQGWVLFDAALDTGHLDDPARLRRLFTDRGWFPPPAVLPEHRLAPQLAALGLGFADIGTVIVSHLHADHSGHLKDLTHARAIVQRAELDHAMGAAPGPAWFREDYDLPGLAWETVEGDATLLPGVEALFTPGHTPGHQSLLVTLPEGPPVILAADVGDLRRNFDETILPGEAADDDAALASLRRLVDLERSLGARMLITHDPDQIRQVPLAPEPYA